jgi:riboflavin transporter FmnP
MSQAKRIAIIAIMGAIVGLIEIFPIIGITDIPFPFYPRLTFDITGVPIMITYFLIGFIPAISVVAIMGVFIGYRNLFGSIFKVIAEVSTLAGFALVYKLTSSQKNKYLQYGLAIFTGVACRVIVMHISNYFLLPVFYGMPIESVTGILIFIDVFNAIQGTVNIALGLTVYNIIKRSDVLSNK